MKTRALVRLILLASVLGCLAEQVPFGIVYGPKAAFNIAAPEGWVIDNGAGAADGLPCVLYRKGDCWENADPLLYAKIASTSVEKAESFATTAIAEMKKERGEYKTKRVESGKTKDGLAWFVNEYSPTKKYPRFERVATYSFPKLSRTLSTALIRKTLSGSIKVYCSSCWPPSPISNQRNDARAPSFSIGLNLAGEMEPK